MNTLFIPRRGCSQKSTANVCCGARFLVFGNILAI